MTILLIATSLLLISCQGIFFKPTKSETEDEALKKYNPQSFYFQNSLDNKLHGYSFKTKEERKGTFIFFHGNSRNITTEIPLMLWVLDAGFDLISFDYSGYGESEGSPSVETVLQDGLDLIEYIYNNGGFNMMGNVILYGQSMGGAVASHAAANSKYADRMSLLILESTFTSWKNIVYEVASKHFYTKILAPFILLSFPNEASTTNLENSKIPRTLILHSTKDDYISFQNGETLFEHAKKPKFLITDETKQHARMINNKEVQTGILEYIETANAK